MAFVNARISDSKKEEFDVAISRRRMTLQSAVAEAIDLWIDPSRKAESYTGPNADWHRRLDIILTMGSPRDVVGIQQNIEWAVRAISSGTTSSVPVASGQTISTETDLKPSGTALSPDNIALQQLLIELQNDGSEEAQRRLGMIRTTLEGRKRSRDAKAKKEAAKPNQQKPDTGDRRQQTGS